MESVGVGGYSVPTAGRGRGIGPDWDQDAATVVISYHRLCQLLLAGGRGTVSAMCMHSVLCTVLSTVSCVAEMRMPLEYVLEQCCLLMALRELGRYIN